MSISPSIDDPSSSRDQSDESISEEITDPAKWIAFYEEEIEFLDQHQNSHTEDKFYALLQLGSVLADNPDLGDAEPSLWKASEAIESVWGWESLYSQECIKTLAQVLAKSRKFVLAQRLLQKASNQIRRSHGREHPWTLELQNNQGCILTAAGKFKEAEHLFESCLEGKLRIFGSNHRTVLKAQSNLVIVRYLQGDNVQFQSELPDILKRLKELYGLIDKDVLTLACQLRDMYTESSFFSEADKIQRDYLFEATTPREYAGPFQDNLIPYFGHLLRTSNSSNMYHPLPETDLFNSRLNDGSLQDAQKRMRRIEKSHRMLDKWTGMGVRRFMGALGFPRGIFDNYWALFDQIVTEPDVMLEHAAADGRDHVTSILLRRISELAETHQDGHKNSFLANALFEAVRSGSEKVVSVFIEHGVDVEQMNDYGSTALHVAAFCGYQDIFRLLLQQSDLLSAPDKDGFTPLDLALERNNEEIIRSIMVHKGALVPSSKSGIPRLSTERAVPRLRHQLNNRTSYTGLKATVSNFYIDQVSKVEERRVRRELVEDLVTKQSLLRSALGQSPTRDVDTTPHFSWIHLPATNMQWVEALMETMAEIEHCQDSCSRSMTDELWKSQLHRALHPSYHGQFMKPSCHQLRRESPGIVLYMPYLDWEFEEEQAKAHAVMRRMEKRTTNFSISQSKTGGDVKRTVRVGPSKSIDAEPDVRLLENYLRPASTESPLHVRRTLDQFKYYMIDDTSARDSDQVVSRYFRRRYPSWAVPVMMVNQLWLWIIDESTIITCSAERWGATKSKNDPKGIFDKRNLIDSILDNLDVKYRDPVLSVFDLAEMIIGQCVGVHRNSAQLANDRHRYLEVFDHSINLVSDEEIRNFNRLADSDEKKAPKTSRNTLMNGGPKSLAEKADAQSFSRMSDSTVARAHSESPGPVEARKFSIIFPAIVAIFRFMQELGKAFGQEVDEEKAGHNRADENFDIAGEIRLLREVRDIRDELSILRTLFEQQYLVISAYSRSIRQEETFKMTDAVLSLTKTVDRMENEAKRPHKDLEDLLDLKQKQANISEARNARISGNTITVFTVVTIIFLPASFMAAFLALPIAEFPFVDELLGLTWVSKWTAIVTAAVGVPFIFFALNINPILRKIEKPVHALFKLGYLCWRLPFLVYAALILSAKLSWLALKNFRRIGSWLAKHFTSISTGVAVVREYPSTRKQAKASGESWSKRRYFIGGWLRRREARRDDVEREVGSQRQSRALYEESLRHQPVAEGNSAPNA